MICSGAPRRRVPNDAPTSQSRARRFSTPGAAPVWSVSLWPHLVTPGSSVSICRPACSTATAQRGVYSELHQGSLLDRLPFDDDRFGSVVSVGVFTLGHVDGTAFAELARVTAPGGHVSITIRDDAVDRLGYRTELQRLFDAGVWELVDLTEPMALIHEDGDDIMLRVWTLRVK